MSTGISGSPLAISSEPKEKRGVPVIKSIPIVENNSPKEATSKPFSSDLPDTSPTMVNAKISNVVNSGGPNFKATIASGAATRINTISLKISAMTEAYIAIFRALRALPFLARG